MSLKHKETMIFYDKNKEYIVSINDYLKVKVKEHDKIKVLDGYVSTIDTFERGIIELEEFIDGKHNFKPFDYGCVEEIIEHIKDGQKLAKIFK